MNIKREIIGQINELTEKYFERLERILKDNNYVYAPSVTYKAQTIPFNGILPEINKDMLEDLCLDSYNGHDIDACLHDLDYVKSEIAKYNDYYSPKNRILRHMDEIKRLKEKYGVKDEELQK